MTIRGTHRTPVAVLAAALALCALSVPASAATKDGVLWQGTTPENQTAFSAAVGRELAIPLEAAGPLGSSTVISADHLPSGARLESVSDAPAKAVFRWRPTAKQIGDWIFVFDAVAPRATAPPLTVYVHVGRRASRAFRLSNVAGLSYNATLIRPVAARARPSSSSRVVAPLRLLTPELVPHVVYLLRGSIDRRGRYWLKVRLPVLPNGTTAWIPRSAVEEFQTVDTHLVINRSRFRAVLYRRGRPIFSSIVGVGEPRWPTPRGEFYVRERLTGFTDPIYGAIAFGLNARSPVLTDWPGGGFVGIHGTNRPDILPGRVSHGCVRMPNRSITRLDRLMKVGTPVTIR